VVHSLCLIQVCLLSDSESYITTDGQSASLSWNKAPVWGLRPDFYYCQTVADLLMWGALSDEKTGLSFTIASGPRHRSHFLGSSPLGLLTIFHFLRYETSLFVASYDSQGYGGGIRTRLHTGLLWPPFITFREPCKTHRLEVFRYCCLCIRCAGNMFSSMVAEPVVQQRTSFLFDNVKIGNMFS
jgi:hypothetical protein